MPWEVDESYKTNSGRLRGTYRSAGKDEIIYHTSQIYFDESIPADSVASAVGALSSLAGVDGVAPTELDVRVTTAQDYYWSEEG